MRYILSSLALLGIAGPVFAGHLAYNPPGQAAAMDQNEGANGKDYAPGQLAREYEETVGDRNGDGKVNGRDYAPGQNPRR